MLRNLCTNDDAKACPWTSIIKMSFSTVGGGWRGKKGVESHLAKCETRFCMFDAMPVPSTRYAATLRDIPLSNERWDDR